MSRQSSVLQHAYILHSRPYRETSLIADLLSEELGRVSVIFKGVRGKKMRSRPVLQPFTRLLVSWQGQHDLKTVTSVEPCNERFTLSGHFLFSGLYVNELLQRLLHPLDPCPELYQLYCDLLSALSHQLPLEPLLRIFEMELLELLGYGLPLHEEVHSGNSLDPESWYHFDPHHGFSLAANSSGQRQPGLYRGEWLISLADRRLEDAEQLRVAKQVMRKALAALLGGRPLRSRELFL